MGYSEVSTIDSRDEEAIGDANKTRERGRWSDKVQKVIRGDKKAKVYSPKHTRAEGTQCKYGGKKQVFQRVRTSTLGFFRGHDNARFLCVRLCCVVALQSFVDAAKIVIAMPRALAFEAAFAFFCCWNHRHRSCVAIICCKERTHIWTSLSLFGPLRSGLCLRLGGIRICQSLPVPLSLSPLSSLLSPLSSPLSLPLSLGNDNVRRL